jgi:RNA polymerase sigma-70 factor, ECF subfamily
MSSHETDVPIVRSAARRRLPTPGRRLEGGPAAHEVTMTAHVRHVNESDGETHGGHRATHDDTELVALAVARTKEGDSSALHFLYVRYREDVHRYVKSIVGDYHEAEDITQSLFVKLMSAIQGYQPRAVPFAAWLMRVARNAALDSVRAKRALPSEDIRASDEGRGQIAFERCQALKEALARLPYEQREVLVLRYIAGIPPREIAELLNKTQSSIHGLHHRGRRALKATLEELDATPLTA